MSTAYILIPCYNEEDNIDLLYQNLSQCKIHKEKFYVFVDDGSKDQTVKKIKDLFKDEPLQLITKDRNYGPGHSFELGFEWILSHSADEDDLVITMEADNTSDLGILQEMIIQTELGRELVLSSVYAAGGRIENIDLGRRVLSYLANRFFRFFFDIRVLTLSSFYRVYSLSLLRKIQGRYPKIIEENGFICMLEILIKAIRQKAIIAEVPMILDSNKRRGTSKMDILKTTFHYLRFLFKRKDL